MPLPQDQPQSPYYKMSEHGVPPLNRYLESGDKANAIHHYLSKILAVLEDNLSKARGNHECSLLELYRERAFYKNRVSQLDKGIAGLMALVPDRYPGNKIRLDVRHLWEATAELGLEKLCKVDQDIAEETEVFETSQKNMAIAIRDVHSAVSVVGAFCTPEYLAEIEGTAMRSRDLLVEPLTKKEEEEVLTDLKSLCLGGGS